MAATARARKASPVAVADPDDDVPEFTTKTTAEPTGPLLFRVDGKDWRLPGRQSVFGASLAYLHQIHAGLSVRRAELALLDHLIGADGVAALIRASDIDPARWNAVVGRATRYLVGDPEPEADPGN